MTYIMLSSSKHYVCLSTSFLSDMDLSVQTIVEEEHFQQIVRPTIMSYYILKATEFFLCKVETNSYLRFEPYSNTLSCTTK